MPQALPFITAGAGLYGAIKGSQAQSDAVRNSNNWQQQGIDLQRQLAGPQIQALNSLLGLANSYDPAQEAQAGIGRATDIFQNALGQGLSNVQDQFGNAGSAPGLSSDFGVRSQDVANRVSDPFRAYLADALGNPTEKKSAMFARVLGAAPSGNLSDAYFKAAGQGLNLAGMYQPNYGPSLGLLGQSIQKMFPSSTGTGGGDAANQDWVFGSHGLGGGGYAPPNATSLFGD